jgi:hypothetical protein
MITTAPKSKRPSTARSKTPAYRNRQLAPDKGVNALLSRVTLQEKAAQTICVWLQKAEKIVDANDNFDPQVLFGDFNSRGKLPITIPRSVGHLPLTTLTIRRLTRVFVRNHGRTSSRDEDLQKVILQVI